MNLQEAMKKAQNGEVIEVMEGQMTMDTKEVAMTTTTQTAMIEKRVSPLEVLAAKKMEEIKKLNPDFNLDFMNIFTRMKTNTKGQFLYTLSGEDFILGDKINVKILAGDYMHQYWGEQGTDEEGTLVCYSKNGQKSSIDGINCDQCPHNRMRCGLRLAIAVNVLADGEDPDEVYNYNMPQTGAFAFADYTKLVTKKTHKGLKDVITTMYTVEKDGRDKGQKYNAVQFKLAK